MTVQPFTAALPPTHAVMPETAQQIILVVTAVSAIAAVLFSFWECKKRSDLVPIYVLIGAVLAIFYEPIGDILGMAYYPEIGQITWIDTFNRKIPLFIALIYFCYFPPFILYFLRLCEKGITRSQWWKIWGTTVLLTFLFEPIPLHAGLWHYYGSQPFVVFKFPIYWAFLNATFVFGTAMGVQFIVSHFKGQLNWVIIPALPMLLLCFHGAPSLPVATALNATDNLWLTSAGASISMLLAILISYLGTRIFCTRSAHSSFE